MPNLQTAPTSPLVETNRPQEDYILLDSSSSMQDKWWSTLDAIQSYISILRTNRVTTHCTLDVFSGFDQLGYIARDCPLSDWTPMRDDPPGAFFGSTALYDAINLMCRTLRDRDPRNCAITICTDGEENGSRHTSHSQARALLDWCRAKGWSVTFIGCDFNNSSQARLLGASAQEAIGVQKSLLSSAARNLGQKRTNNILRGAPMHWSEDEQQQFGGYLAPPRS